MPILVCAWLAIAGGVGFLAVRDAAESPRVVTARDAYADHTYTCPQCRHLGAPLCPEGERLRKSARDEGGWRDPRLDR